MRVWRFAEKHHTLLWWVFVLFIAIYKVHKIERINMYKGIANCGQDIEPLIKVMYPYPWHPPASWALDLSRHEAWYKRSQREGEKHFWWKGQQPVDEKAHIECEVYQQQQVPKENDSLIQHAWPICGKRGWSLRRSHFCCHTGE